MAEVEVAINGRSYLMGCDDGQEEHLLLLAEEVGRRVEDLVATVGQVGDARLLLMASLLIADELYDARADAGGGHSQLRNIEFWPRRSSRLTSPTAGNGCGPSPGFLDQWTGLRGPSGHQTRGRYLCNWELFLPRPWPRYTAPTSWLGPGGSVNDQRLSRLHLSKFRHPPSCGLRCPVPGTDGGQVFHAYRRRRNGGRWASRTKTAYAPRRLGSAPPCSSAAVKPPLPYRMPGTAS